MDQVTRREFFVAIFMVLSIMAVFDVTAVVVSSRIGPRGCGNAVACNSTTAGCTIPAGSVSCGKTVTWTTPLPFNPCSSCYSAGINSNGGGVSQSFLANDYAEFFNFGVNCVTPCNWLAFPAITEEIFGNAEPCTNQCQQDRQPVDFSSARFFSWGIFCSSPSTTVNAQLKLQYSRNQVTWTDLSNSLIIVGTSGTACGGTSPFETAEYSAIDAGAQFHNITLRIVGLNGANNGIDPLIVSKAWINFQVSTKIFFMPAIVVQTNQFDHGVITISINLQQTASITIQFSFTAWDCKVLSGGVPC